MVLQNLRFVGDDWYLFIKKLYVLFEADSFQHLYIHNGLQMNVLPSLIFLEESQLYPVLQKSEGKVEAG